MEFYDKIILNNDIADAEYTKSKIKEKYSNKLISELNQHLIDLLANLEKMKEINYNQIDSLLVFAITLKIFYDLGMYEYISIYKNKKIIYIYNEKKTNQIIIEENKNNNIKLVQDQNKPNIKEFKNKICIKTEEYIDHILLMLNDIYSLFFNYKNNKINNSRFEVKFCHVYSLNVFYNKNFSHEVSSEINSDESKKNIFVEEANSRPELKFSSNFNILDKLTIDINKNLFDLLADLITENNYNKERKNINYFLIFVIIYKILYNMDILGYIYIYIFQSRIQICREISKNKLGILEDKNNKIKLSEFIREQNINFNESEKIEIETSKHFNIIKSVIENIFNLFNLIKPKKQKLVKMFCDSITFSSQNIKYFLKRKKEINQNFKYQLNNNNNIKINEKINYDEQTYKNKKRESFLRKIDIFEKRVYDSEKNQ